MTIKVLRQNRILVREDKMKKIIILLTVFALCLGLYGCGEKKSYAEDMIFAMDTYMTFKIYGENAEEIIDLCKEEITLLDGRLSCNDGQSELYRINQSERVELSDQMADIIARSIEMSETTDGAFDITIGALTEIWGFSGGQYRLPSETEIASALKTVGYEKLNLEGNLLSKPIDTKIDLGGIAKGYATDRIFEILENGNAEGAVISLGGNVLTYGQNPEGRDWTVAVTDPDDKNGYVKMLTGSGKSAYVTSGDYQRYFEQDGIRYHHILDPKTGYPAQSGLRSVTVISQNGFEADGLSTAIYAAGTEKASAFSKKTDAFKAVYVTDGKEVAEQSYGQ